MKQYDACALCLQKVRDPVACSEGHLFCKECVYTDLGESTFAFQWEYQMTVVSKTEKGH